MPKADGTIVIDTAIQDAGFKAGTKELEMACRRAANSVSDIGDKSRIATAKAVNAFAKQNDAIRRQEEKVDSLKRKLGEMGSEQVETEAFSAVNNEIDRLYKKLDALDAKKARFLATGGNESSNAFQKLEYDASLIAEELDKAISKKNELLAGGGAYTNADVSRVAQQLAIEQAKLDQQTKNLNVSFASLNQRIEQYKQNSDNASKSTGTLEKSFSRGIKQALKYGLGIRSLYVLTNKLRSALKEGLSNYLEFDPGAKAAVDKFNNSLTQLKNSVATAFLPIINIVGPILLKLIDWLSSAVTWVGMFIATLSGSKTYKKATAIQNGYAGALNNTAAAAKEAQKNLSGLDEITTWQNSKASGGAGGGISGGGGVSPSEMFEEVELKSAGEMLTDLWEGIKNGAKTAWEYVKNIDWKGVWEGIKNGAKTAWEWLNQPFEINIDQGHAAKQGKTIGSSIWREIKSSLFNNDKEAENLSEKHIGEPIKRGLKNYIGSNVSNFESFGRNVVSGFEKGLMSGARDVGDVGVKTMGFPLEKKVKGFYQIHSPSKVSEGWGKYIITGLLNGFKNTMNLVLTWVPSFGSLLSGKFTSIGDSIVTTFQNMKGRVYSIFDGLKNVLRTPLNGIIGFLNRLISGVVSGINTAIRAINRIKVTIPSWIPGVGGKSIGFHLSTITAPTIPYLATGAVIPPNAPFTAVLGDQRNGTNLEAPESLIRKIVREESGGGNYRFTAQINRRTLFDEMISEAKIRQSATGKNPFVMA